MILESDLLVIDGQRIRLPDVYVDTYIQIWKVPNEYRETGYFIAVQKEGEPLEVPACSQADAQYLGELNYPAPEANKLRAARAEKLAELLVACESGLAELSGTYPAGELQSWPQQVAEAAALQVDPPGAAPLLMSISQARGVSVAELARRVQEKAAAYATYSGEIIGKRQALEDRVAAAITIGEVEEIKW